MNYFKKYQEDNNGFATHQPVLEFILKKLKHQIVLELGCGEGSTELIEYYSHQNNLKIITIDSDATWLNRYNHLHSDTHEFILIENFDNWAKYFNNNSNNYGLIFIDQGNWTSRKESLFALKNSTEYVILHDCCYYPKNNIFGKILEEKCDIQCSYKYPKNCPGCCSYMNNLKRDYSDIFKYHKEYMSPYGPPTLLGSDKIDVTKFYIEME